MHVSLAKNALQFGETFKKTQEHKNALIEQTNTLK